MTKAAKIITVDFIPMRGNTLNQIREWVREHGDDFDSVFTYCEEKGLRINLPFDPVLIHESDIIFRNEEGYYYAIDESLFYNQYLVRCNHTGLFCNFPCNGKTHPETEATVCIGSNKNGYDV